MKKKIKSGVIWVTGLSGAGKTTFASEIYQHLKKKHPNVVFLDGDMIRVFKGDYSYGKDTRLKTAFGTNKLLTFLEQSNLIVIVAVISAFKEIYALNRQTFQNYFEIYVHCDLNELIRRDKNGLYSGALKGEIKDVYGMDIPYEKPNAHFVLENSAQNRLKEKTALLCAKVDAFLKKC